MVATSSPSPPPGLNVTCGVELDFGAFMIHLQPALHSRLPVIMPPGRLYAIRTPFQSGQTITDRLRPPAHLIPPVWRYHAPRHCRPPPPWRRHRNLAVHRMHLDGLPGM